jgi:hypothetical protein
MAFDVLAENAQPEDRASFSGSFDDAQSWNAPLSRSMRAATTSA